MQLPCVVPVVLFWEQFSASPADSTVNIILDLQRSSWQFCCFASWTDNFICNSRSVGVSLNFNLKKNLSFQHFTFLYYCFTAQCWHCLVENQWQCFNKQRDARTHRPLPLECTWPFPSNHFYSHGHAGNKKHMTFFFLFFQPCFFFCFVVVLKGGSANVSKWTVCFQASNAQHLWEKGTVLIRQLKGVCDSDCLRSRTWPC